MSPPASVTITQLEPVVFLRGQSSSGEDARGRRRPVNVDAPPSQLRGLVTLYLPKPSKIKEITISLKGTAKTDWPEGIGPNRVELVEEMSIFHQVISLYNAKHDKASAAPTRRRSNSVGPGIGLQQDVDWDYAAATANANASERPSPRSASVSSSRQASGSSRSEDERTKTPSGSGASGGSNLARQIAGAAAKAGTAMIPPTLRPDMGLARTKDPQPNSSRSRPPLHRTGSGTTSWTQYATSPDSRAATPAVSPSAHASNSYIGPVLSSSVSPSLPSSPSASFSDPRRPPAAQHQDLSRWHEYFALQGYERPPLYAPRSAPLQGYDTWPTEIPFESPPALEDAAAIPDQAASPSNSVASSAAPSVEATSMDRIAASSHDVPAPSSATIQVPGTSPPKPPTISASGPSASPARSIFHTQPPVIPRAKEQTVRFDPQSRIGHAPPSSTTVSTLSRISANKSAPSSLRSSVELQDNHIKAGKTKSSSKAGNDAKTKKPGFKMLINGLLKEPTADHKAHADDAAHPDSKEFKKGTYTYPICISLPSNLPPTLHADFGFNRYVLRTSVVRAGALTPNLMAEREVTLIHAPDEDTLEETDSIIVERCWEDLLSYMVVFSGKSFPIGQQIPLWLKFVPLGKVKIYRILATLEERTDYFAKGRRVARHEVPRKWTLMKVAHASATEPILPILSDSADALDNSPLAPMARAAAGEDQDSDALPSILDPTGPWELATELSIPACGTTRINLSTNHSKSNIAVHHLVRLSIRVGKSEGDWEVWNDSVGTSSSAAKNPPQLYDIIIEAPITLTSSHTATEWTALPNYWSLPAEPVDQDADRSAEADMPLRPGLPSPVLTSRTGMVGHAPAPLRSSTASNGSPVSTSPPMSRNPTQLSRRWLALSADHIESDGNNARTSNAPGGVASAPPPAYRPNARTGETTVASTSMNRSPSETVPPSGGSGSASAPSTASAYNVGLAH
ncbi:uncharacterized protein UMAG_01968 [Mycosarcoma maydis]|uniref:Arrestin C-terminal-like domain-containing protein n=1 Tax=Mycosarcoma maydis TaxID=5270 RepID=A0A0D1E8U6_MYCMD|nr:uncharacterized protein UMAG_01968 [Ustilago maydis 521]KIS70820.1 hypothetical protein UMAG_01968 [Ustilago maydis 521]|eukprot:XP_011387885.1 hypothetical protein UMAG_01968 [Ustilago maydis 521]